MKKYPISAVVQFPPNSIPTNGCCVALATGFLQIIVPYLGMALLTKKTEPRKSWIKFFYLIGFLGLFSCGDAVAQTTIGAKTPFTTYEGETGTLAGGATATALTSPPTTASASPQLEASGHAYAALTGTGQSITWTNNTSATTFNGINIRFCIPDASGGGGTTATLDLYVNGTFRQTVTLSSAQEWLYEVNGNENGQSNSPSYGVPHKFWDDAHFLISGAGVAPGSTISLRKNSTNTAAFYRIDCVDLEAVPAALTQPANSLSIVSYGAVPNNSTADSSGPIQNCISAAQSSGKSVWIPAGTFYLKTFTGGLSATGITFEGAGPWYSTIYRQVNLPSGNVANMLNFASCTIRNLCLDENAPSRADGAGGGINPTGTNWTIHNVWIQHMLSGIWARGVGGTVQNCRILSTYADGININNGGFDNTTPSENTGNNLTVYNNFIRGAGDDGISLNCQAASYKVPMNSCVIMNNTTVAPWWMNNLAVYGGTNTVVKNNLLMDAVKNNGMFIGAIGNDDSLVSGIFQGNSILRGGSFGFGVTHPALSIGTDFSTTTNSINSAYISSNLISNSMFEGIHLYQNTGNVVVENNVVATPGTAGVIIDSIATGSGTLNSNLVSRLGSGQSAFTNNSGSFNLNTTAQFVGVPIEASSYNSASNLQTVTCSEGGQCLGNISNGSYSVYNNVNIDGATQFAIRTACGNTSGSSITVRLDSPTGTVIGTIGVPYTGGWNTWTTTTGSLSGASGTHNIYLVYGGAVNVEWFAFQKNSSTFRASDYNNTSNIQTASCVEGGLSVTYNSSGAYTAYNNFSFYGVTGFVARVASSLPTTQSAGSISVYLDSPTGTLVGTCQVNGTGGAQNWATVNCPITGASGIHNVYLVSNGTFNLEWFSFPGIVNRLSNGVYQVIAQSSGLSLAATGTTNGSVVQQQTFAYTPAQQWDVTHLGNNVYELAVTGTTAALEVPGGTTTLQANLDVSAYTGATYQQWQLAPVGGGYYKIINVNSGYAANVNANSMSSGASICQWLADSSSNGLWSFEIPGCIIGGSYEVVAQSSGLSLAATGTTNGSAVQQQTSTGATTQQWTATHLGNNVYELAVTGTTAALEAPGGTKTLQANLDVSAYTGATHQQWTISPVGGGYNRIINVNSGYAVNVNGNSMSSGASICQWIADNVPNGVWAFNFIGNGTYNVVVKSSGLSLAATGTGNGSAVQQQTYSQVATKQWTVTNLGNNIVKMALKNTTAALEAPGGTTTLQAFLDVSTYSGATYQQWQIVPVGGGYNQIVNVNSGYAANVNANSMSSGASICQWTAGNVSNGVWKFTAP